MPLTLPEVIDLHDPELALRLQRKIDQKTKPLGSLGQLETWAQQLGLILGTESPQLQQAQMVVFAADHGLVQQGVSAYPSEVTWQMVQNFLSGGACVSVLARQHGLALHVADCGVNHQFDAHPGLWDLKVGMGTADASRGPAMTMAQCQQALNNGLQLLEQLPGNVLLLGEMGIGNTSAASLLMSRLLNLDIALCTGAGTGLDDAGVQRKLTVLRQVLQLHAQVTEPLAVLASMGGFEIATMVGAIVQAAALRRVIVVDGFITTAAVLVAQALQPRVLQRCVFAHQSGERGHALLLQHLRVRPLLQLGLRLGEGSGAALAWPLLQSAAQLMCEMASFEAAGVAKQTT